MLLLYRRTKDGYALAGLAHITVFFTFLLLAAVFYAVKATVFTVLSIAAACTYLGISRGELDAYSRLLISTSTYAYQHLVLLVREIEVGMGKDLREEGKEKGET